MHSPLTADRLFALNLIALYFYFVVFFSFCRDSIMLGVNGCLDEIVLFFMFEYVRERERWRGEIGSSM